MINLHELLNINEEDFCNYKVHFAIKNIRKTKINLAFFLEKLKKTCSQNPPRVLFKLKKP